MDKHESLTYYFFLGLIIGILPFLFRKSNAFTMFRWQHALLMLLGIVLISIIPIDQSADAAMTNLTFSSSLLLFFAGLVASAAMVLRGTSGSFIFLVLWWYNQV